MAAQATAQTRGAAPQLDAPANRAAARAVITPEGERELRAELERQRRALEVETASRLREARALGDPSGNDDYLQILEEQAVLASRVKRLETLLDEAMVVDGATGSPTVVAIGTVVEIEDDRGAGLEVRLVGSHERFSPGAVSATSPVGGALMGRAPGDVVEAELPNGARRPLKVVSIRAAESL